MSSEERHLLRPGDTVYHLPSRRGATVLHVSARRGGMVLLRFAGGEERSYPVDELRARDQRTDDWTMRCRVSE